MKQLLDSRCIHKIEDGVKLLSVVSCSRIFEFMNCILTITIRVPRLLLLLSQLKFLEHHKRLLKPLKRLVVRLSLVIIMLLV